MALVKCEECEKSISDQAENCVHCGAPLSMQSAIQVNVETTVENWFNSCKVGSPEWTLVRSS
jgi:hypothetical protein